MTDLQENLDAAKAAYEAAAKAARDAGDAYVDAREAAKAAAATYDAACDACEDARAAVTARNAAATY